MYRKQPAWYKPAWNDLFEARARLANPLATPKTLWASTSSETRGVIRSAHASAGVEQLFGGRRVAA
jgi:hypothetical protein